LHGHISLLQCKKLCLPVLPCCVRKIFLQETSLEVGPIDLFLPGFDEKPRAKGPTTRAMARRIQEEWALNAHARPKMNFTWAKEDVKT